MAFTFVGAGPAAWVASDTSLTVTYPSGVQEDDTLLFFIAKSNMLAEAGWTLFSDGQARDFYIRRAGPSEPTTATFDTSSAGEMQGVMVAYRGALTGDEYDADANISDSSGARTTSTGPNLTTTVKNDLVVLYVDTDANPAPWANIGYPAGFTERFKDDSVGDLPGDRQLIAADGIQAAVGASGTLDCTHDSYNDTTQFIALALKNGGR